MPSFITSESDGEGETERTETSLLFAPEIRPSAAEMQNKLLASAIRTLRGWEMEGSLG